MDSLQIMVRETLKLDFALEALGINPLYMAKLYPYESTLSSFGAVRMLFNFVHLDTQFGQQELPIMLPSPMAVAYAKANFRKQLNDTRFMDLALDKYVSDLEFRAGLHTLYKEGVLPMIREIEKSSGTYSA